MAAASTLKKATGHGFHELSSEPALMLTAGVAAFLLGDAMFRRTLAIGTNASRLVAAALAFVTIPLGTEVSAFAQLLALVALLAAALSLERTATRALSA